MTKALAKTLWFLDYDGSLCPHQEVWEERIYSTDEILDVLRILTSKSRDIFWNTGRRVESLGGVDRRFLDIHGYFIQGSVYWDAQTKKEIVLGPSLDSSLKTEILSHFRDQAHFRVEIKPTSARVAPMDLRHLDELNASVALLEKRTPPEWEWRSGARGAELLAKGFSKASAIDEQMAKAKAGSIPVAVGDDVFDRPAVERALALGGYAILIGEGCGWITSVPHKPDQVMFFQTPASFHDWIRDL